ncbi:universal stress protein [Chitinimonas viridis]|uniref:Universal stress protein n=1 Tax=Chitinimonas viridis TaxID=664880 RepID=A0ABT8B057_9NEIS|nr:universal stress protein [Chitinimonas viridis]MDN3575434.1 universal stress protein [Chitinimonas viridis]
MSYRNILVQVDSGPHAAARIRFALHLAQAHEAHLTGLFVAPSPYINVMEPGGGAGSVYYAIHEDIERAAIQARELFERLTQQHPNQSSWHQQIGVPAEAICLHARYQDLVVMGQHDPASPADGLPATLLQDVAMACGRPVLAVPHAGSFPTLDQHAMVAWNGSREATRALTDALPLLRRAKKVTVLIVNASMDPGVHGQLPGADVGLYLARHGVEVEVVKDTAFSRDIGEVLLTVAADRQVDLLVMGLYGHSRLREMVMGGASRTMLEAMTVPVLMSH